MPTIEITSKQAEALARGENVTLVPEARPEELHNVIVFQKCGRSFYVWDGEKQPNGVVWASRWQKLTDGRGRPLTNPVGDYRLRVAFAKNIAGRYEGHTLAAIVQVGA